MVFFFFFGWGMGFMKAGPGLCEFGILDYEGFFFFSFLRSKTFNFIKKYANLPDK